LRDAAIAIKVKDQEDGAAGFGDKMADGAEMRSRRQQEYEDCCKEYVATMTLLDASSKIGYEEGVLAGLSDFAMKERVAKRMRAEQIMENLATGVGGKFGDGSEEVVADDNDSQKRLRMHDDTTQKITRKRKQRTMVDDNTSTSGASSDSESDSDSSSGESVVVVAGRRINYGESSSSSSSSSSEEDSDSEDESDDSGDAGDGEESAESEESDDSE